MDPALRQLLLPIARIVYADYPGGHRVQVWETGQRDWKDALELMQLTVMWLRGFELGASRDTTDIKPCDVCGKRSSWKTAAGEHRHPTCDFILKARGGLQR